MLDDHRIHLDILLTVLPFVLDPLVDMVVDQCSTGVDWRKQVDHRMDIEVSLVLVSVLEPLADMLVAP